jgi:NADH-quinone oxidoreductase subunit A
MLPIGEGAPRFSVKFYLVAMLFVIFDIEVVFMYPWAVQFRDLVASNGSVALVSMTGFAGILVFAYVYALKKGALNWKS